MAEPVATPAEEAARPPGKGRRRAAAAPLRTGGLGRPWIAALALGVSGFVSLTLQVVWSRLLAQILGPTTYAFSLVVAVFIAGLALGAVAGRWLANRVAQPAAGLSLCISVALLAAMAAASTVDAGLLAIARAVAAPEATFTSVLTRQVLLAAAWLLPLALGLGCAFPFAVRTGTGADASLGADLGLIYAVNTIGAIAGALAAGFVLVPRLGLYDTLRGLGVAAALAAIALAWRSGLSLRARMWATAAGASAAVASAALPAWSPELLSSGAYKYAATMTGDSLELSLAAGRLLYFRDGASATVAVRDAAGTTSLAIDGKVDASNAGDMLTQRLLAHVPLLLHPAPRQAAILGLGSGVTLGSALRHPLERVDVLEISPEVVEASRFFEPENSRALADPRTRLIVGDGRTHLLLGRTQYDVIVSEPSNPWMAGIASLFTREFFAAAKARLAPGGVLCQWAHTYDISAEDLRSIVATFAAVFPDGTIWLVGDGDVLLIGGTEPMGPRVAALAEVWSRRPEAVADLAQVGARDPFGVLSLLVAEGDGLARFAAGAPLLTDDYARVEFSGPRTVFSRNAGDNAAALRGLAAELTVPGGRGRPGPPPLPPRGATAAGCCSRPAPRGPPGPTSRAHSAAIRATCGRSRAWCAPAPPPAAGPRPWRCCANWRHLPTTWRPSWPCRASWPRPGRCRRRPRWRSRSPSGTPRMSPLWNSWPRFCPMSGTRTGCCRWSPGCARLRRPRTRRATTPRRCSSSTGAPTRPSPRPGCWWPTTRATRAATTCSAPPWPPPAAAKPPATPSSPRSRSSRVIPSTYTNLGLLELETGNRTAGLQRLAEALLLDPNAGPAREAYDRESSRAASR